MTTWSTRESLQTSIDTIKREHGEWTFDIPLPFGLWTRGNEGLPHTRLRRVLQIVHDLANKPLRECRVLDLGCLDGIFAIEFAKHGCETVGVEIREANIRKAELCRDALGLSNLTFLHDDVRNISRGSHGAFDAIVCSGILYHLPAVDALKLLVRMFEMVQRVVVIDTHIALRGVDHIRYDGADYWGDTFTEHFEHERAAERAKKLWASPDNATSFWFTRPSLINALTSAGFSSVYECFAPAHINFGRPGVESRDRCTFVAIKDEACALVTSPSANTLRERWPEDTLTYDPDADRDGRFRLRPIVKRAFVRLRDKFAR